MRPKDPFRSLAAALALLLPMLCVLPARADENPEDEGQARAYARDQLVRSARVSVDPGNPEAGGLAELKAVVAKKEALYARLAPAEHERARQLLGAPDEDGLIREAARFYRWIASAPAAGEAPEDPTTRPTGLPALRRAAEDWQRRVDMASRAASDDAAEHWLHPHVLALVHAEELETAISKAALERRELEISARIRALQAEQAPRGLVNDRTVEEKALRAQALRKSVATLEADRTRILTALDRLARAERMLREDSGRLGFLIDQARREAAQGKEADPKKGGEPAKDGVPREPEVGDKLARLQLEELVDEQQLRLLYVTVRRADLLRAHYTEVVRLAKDEAHAAEEAHKRFETELSRMRRERQLERLAWQASELKRERTEAQASAGGAPEAAQATWQAYAKALTDLVQLNQLTREAVALRRELEARARPECAPGEGSDAEGCLPPPAPPEGEADPPEGGAPNVDDPLRRFRDPRQESIDAAYVRDATALLDHPAWSAELAARHFAAVDDRIQVLEQALALVPDTNGLRSRFDAVADRAAADLERVKEQAAKEGTLWRWYSRVRDRRTKNLEADRSAFAQTMRGIDEEQQQIRGNLAAFRVYRRALLDLGPRSFRIRVERTLDPDRLEAAYDDVDATVDRAGRWLSLQGDDHAGTFVGRNWLMLLACLVVLVGSIVAVRLGRRGLDRMLRTLATRVPALRSEPVTVRAEEAQARRERAVQEAAAKAAEEEALRQVSKEEAERQQQPGAAGPVGEDA